MELAAKNRQPGFTKRPLRQDVLYNFFRFRDLSISSKKTSLEVTRITDVISRCRSSMTLVSCSTKWQIELTI